MFDVSELSCASSNVWQRRLCFASSVLLHLGVLLLVGPTALGNLFKEHGGGASETLTTVYIPPMATSERPAAFKPATIAPPQWQSDSGDKIKLDGLLLEIVDDRKFAIIETLSRCNGALGFAPKSEPRYVTRLFQPPGWTPFPLQSWVALDGISGLVVRLIEPERWPIIRLLERRQKIPADDVVYAIFPYPFRAELDRMIREAAARKIQRGQVVAASVAFSTETPAGVIVERVIVEPHQ